MRQRRWPWLDRRRRSAQRRVQLAPSAEKAPAAQACPIGSPLWTAGQCRVSDEAGATGKQWRRHIDSLAGWMRGSFRSQRPLCVFFSFSSCGPAVTIVAKGQGGGDAGRRRGDSVALPAGVRRPVGILSTPASSHSWRAIRISLPTRPLRRNQHISCQQLP